MHYLRQLQPVVTALLAVCLLLLGFAAHSPSFHDAICSHGLHASHECHGEHDHHDVNHEENHDDQPASTDREHACAVTSFANGCEAPSLPVLLAEPVLNAIRVSHFTEFMLARSLRGPARVCGPPAQA